MSGDQTILYQAGLTKGEAAKYGQVGISGVSALLTRDLHYK